MQNNPAVLKSVDDLIKNAEEVKDTIVVASSNLDQYKVELDDIRAANLELQRIAQESTDKEEMCQAQLTDMQARLDELDQQFQELLASKAEVDERIAAFDQEQLDVQSQMEAVIAENERINAELVELNEYKERERLRAVEVEQLNTIQTDLIAQMESLQRQYDDLAKEAQIITVSRAECDVQNQEYAAEINSLTQIETKLRAEMYQLDDQLAISRQETAVANEALADCSFSREMLSKQVKDLETDIASLRAENNGYLQKIRNIENDLAALLNKL